MNRKKKDNSPLGQMRSLIEDLTHSGSKELDVKLLSSLKNLCKQSADFVGRCYQMTMHQLQKDHSEVRYSAFLIIDDFFRRSHCFRELLLADMPQFMELTIETNKDNPLPKPAFTAKALKKKALHAIHEWNKKFGDAYKKLSLAYKFLNKCFKVDFRELEIQNSIEHRRQQEIERKRQEQLEAKAKKIFSEIEENQSEIHQAITSMENCLSLLLPHPKEFFLDSEDVNDDMKTSCGAKESEISKEAKEIETEKTEGVNDDGSDKLGNSIVEESDVLKSSVGESSSESEYESEGEENINLREYGVINPLGTITIDLKLKPEDVKVTEENSAIIENARDLFTILSTRHLVDVKKWIQILSKSGSSDKLKSLIDLKQSIEALLKKYCELNLPMKKVAFDSDDSDTSDFEEVKPKEDYEDNVVEPLPSTSKALSHHLTKSNKTATKGDAGKSDWFIISQENNVKDPTSALSTYSSIVSDKKMETGKKPEESKTSPVKMAGKTKESVSSEPSTSSGAGASNDSRKSRLLAVAPKVPFDLDLYHWENEQVPSAVMMTSHPDSHNFWSSSTAEDAECQVPVEMSGLSRVIEFSGKFNPVKWTCRAPLPSGKLCPRRDRVKCPFHGPVVPRDEQGNVCEVDGKMPVLPPKKPEVPDWQDPELLRDIQSQIGIDLTIPEKGKRKKKQQSHPGLTDLKAAQNTTYNRLAKKIFKKSTMKRVASTLDTIDHKKFRDKFGDQFNYS